MQNLKKEILHTRRREQNRVTKLRAEINILTRASRADFISTNLTRKCLQSGFSGNNIVPKRNELVKPVATNMNESLNLLGGSIVDNKSNVNELDKPLATASVGKESLNEKSNFLNLSKIVIESEPCMSKQRKLLDGTA